MTLLITTAVLPATSSINVFNSSLHGEVKDQYVEWDAEVDPIIDFDWQEFVPTMVRHTRIEVKIVQWYGGSEDLKLSIERPLGTILRYKELPVNDIPGYCDWVSFDIQDIDLVPGQNYYIKLTAPLGSEYGWGSSPRDPYPQGDSSKGSGTGWDWCFRTYCMENSPPNKPNMPTGTNSGKAGTSYTYSTSTDDPDGDQVWYKWDWGNEVSNWDGPYTSGDPVTTSHTWPNQGSYAVKVKAKDTSDVESVWSDPLSVSMPKSKTTATQNNNEIHSMIYCDVSIKGTATEQVIRGSFLLGFGKCLYMKVDLENDGSIEISSITNPSNNIELEGSYQIHLIGFNGFYSHLLKTRINGRALLTIWE